MAFDPNLQQSAQVQGGQSPQPQAQMGGDLSQVPQGPGMQTGQPQPGEAAPEASPEDKQAKMMASLNAAIESHNLAEKMDDEDLKDIADICVKGYDEDLISMGGWLENNKDWLKLALLMRENKTFPWPGAANVKYPLIATAAMQFSARSYPTLVPADNQLVKARIIGYDPDGQRAEKADRISKHMSYQVMHRMPDWEEDMDRLLMVTAISGVCFKKTYKDVTLNRIVSKIVYPENLIVNYWAKSLECAFRKTELLYYNTNEVEEKIRSGEYLDVDLPDPTVSTADSTPKQQAPRVNDANPPVSNDLSTPHLFLAQHTYYDLDDDGYAEPVVVTVHKDTRKVVRITARFASDAITFGKKGKVTRIDALEYFTDFQFIPNPDGSIYGLGFGALLGPLNEAINSLINQLVDAGTLNNLQGGFISKGLRIAMKDTKLRPGEWMAVNATGDDMKNGIFPLPSKEPSTVLFQLMNFLVTSGNQLASVAEIFVGKMPGQNTPASTTQETVDQSMKVFTSIFKRIYRALLREFNKIYRLNSLSPEIIKEESDILNIPLTVSDYEGSQDDIIPSADPSGSSKQQQFGQLQQVGQTLLPTGVINMQEFALRSLKLSEIPAPEKLVNPPQPPPPDPKVETEKMKQQTMQMKGQQDAQKAQMDMQLKQQDAQLQQQLAEMDMKVKAMELQFKEQELKLEAAGQQQKMQMDQITMLMDQKARAVEHSQNLQAQAVETKQNLAVNKAMGDQKIKQGDQMHKQKIAQAKATAKAAPKKGA